MRRPGRAGRGRQNLAAINFKIISTQIHAFNLTVASLLETPFYRLSFFILNAGAKPLRGKNHHSFATSKCRIPNRDFYCRWIHSTASALARIVFGLKWKLRRFTRIASWGRDFQTVKKYIRHNYLEGLLILEVHAGVEKFWEEESRMWAAICNGQPTKVIRGKPA